MRLILETAHRTLRGCERDRKLAWAFRSFVLDACASDSVRGTMHPMKCAFCNKALAQGSSSRKRFCDDSHRASYWREHSTQSPKGKRGRELNGAKSQVGASGTEKPRNRKPQIPRAHPHTIAHRTARVPMTDQLRGLAPENAVGYRLVLPTRTPDDVPRLSPPLDATGYQGHYSLSPFQAPYDIRLIDGQTYRVVWIGASGEVIPPNPDGTIPGLHFFLTSSAATVGVDPEAASSESQFAHIPTETERLRKALATALPALQELLTCLTALAAEQTAADQAASEESVSLTQEESVSPAESIASSESITAPESSTQNETSAEGIGVLPEPTVENVTTDHPSAAPPDAQEHWDAQLMSEDERQWAIRWALDEDKVTLLFRELLRRTKGVDAHHPATDNTYVPRAEDVKELAMIEGNFAIAAATVELHKELMGAPLVNPTGEYPQPRHIPPLGDFEKQRVLAAFRSPEQRAYFAYRLSRRNAFRVGVPLTPQPKAPSGFNRELRRKLEKLFQDSRATALMAALLQPEWTAAEKSVRKDAALPPSLLALGRS